jgi:hypothetical protein
VYIVVAEVVARPAVQAACTAVGEVLAAQVYPPEAR